MNRNWNAPNLSTLGGRTVAVHLPRSRDGPAVVARGTIEVRDVAGDQDGPAVVVVLDHNASAPGSTPHTIALGTETIERFLAAPPDAALEIAIDAPL